MSTDDCTPSTTFIYALLDSRTGHVRYVGKSDDPDRRMLTHCHDRCRGHKQNWLRQMEKAGLYPVLRILEECDRAEWQERERYWIAFYRAAGEPLTNLTDGGEGTSGRVELPESGAQRSDAMRNYYATPEGFAQASAKSSRLWESPLYREKTTKAIRERWSDPELREKHAEVMRRAYSGPDVRARTSERMKAEWADPVAGEKRRETLSSAEVQACRTAGIQASYDRPEVRQRHVSGATAAWAARTVEERAEVGRRISAARQAGIARRAANEASQEKP